MRTEASSIFIVPNATFIAELIAFAIILYVLWRYVVPPVQKAMRDRQETIRRQLEESKEAKERMEAAEADYRQSIADARAQAAKIREDARAERDQILAEVRSRTQEEQDRIRKKGEEQLAAYRRQVISELRHDIGRMSVQLASQIVGESLEDDARQRRTVERFLGELDGMAPPDDEAQAEPSGGQDMAAQR